MSTSVEAASSRPFPVAGVRRRWRLVAALAALGLLAGLVLAVAAPVRYASTVSLVLEPSLGNAYAPTDVGQALVNITTEVVVAKSEPVAEKVRAEVDSDRTAKELRESVSVEQLPNSQVVEMTATADTSAEARELANAFAEAFLEYRQEVSVEATQNLLTGLETSTASARAAIDSAVRRLAEADPQSRAAELARSRVRSASATLTELETQTDQVRFSQSEPGRVLSPASRPTPATNRWLYVGGGLLAGLLVGLAVAVRRALGDDRIHSAADLGAVGPPVLAGHPGSRDPGRDGARDGAVDPGTDEGRVLAASFRGRLGPDRSAVVIAAVGPGADSLQVALGLVEALRADAVDVALVELAGEPGPDRQPELQPVASGGHALRAGTLEDAVADDTDAPVYRVRDERLDKARFRELLGRMGARHELVVVSGRVLGDPATLDAVEAVGDTLLVVPMGRYSQNGVRGAVDQVRLFHGRVVALIAG